MSILMDLCMNAVPYLPRPFVSWLYKPERMLEHLAAHISAQQGSVEVFCDKEQAKLNLWVEFRNDNPFSIEIDRVVASAHLHTAYLKASNLIGSQLKKGHSVRLLLEGRLDEVNRERVNTSPSEATMRVILSGVIANKYHTTRTWTATFENLMYRPVNKGIDGSQTGGGGKRRNADN